jgi:hypothetical protein
MLQFSITARNAMLDQIEVTVGPSAVIKLFTGSVPANCSTPDSGTKIVEFDLAPDWTLPAADGLLTFANLPLSIAAVADGIVGYFRVYDSGGTTCHMQGTITSMAGGGDMVADNTNTAAGQSLKLWTASISAPGA